MKIASVDFAVSPLEPFGELWTSEGTVDMRRLVQPEVLPELVAAVRRAGLTVIDGINGIPYPSGTDELIYHGNDPELAHVAYPTLPYFVPYVDILYPGKNPADMAFAKLPDLATGAQSAIRQLKHIVRGASSELNARYDLDRLLAQTRAEGGFYPDDFRVLTRRLPSWDEVQAESPGSSSGFWESQRQLDARAKKRQKANQENVGVFHGLKDFYTGVTRGAPRYTHSWASRPNSVVLTFQGTKASGDLSKIVLPFCAEPKCEGPMGVRRDFISPKHELVYKLFSRWLAGQREWYGDDD